MIIVIALLGPTGQTVRSRAKFKVKTVADCLVGIVGATPVTDNSPFPTPLALEYLL